MTVASVLFRLHREEENLIKWKILQTARSWTVDVTVFGTASCTYYQMMWRKQGRTTNTEDLQKHNRFLW
jgi:hypothetical protein